MMVHRGAALVLALALALQGGCSLVGIHYRDPATEPVDCERLRVLPMLDTAAAVGALATSAYRYHEQTRTSPWPISAIVVAAWAAASASYGYYETAECRRRTRELTPLSATGSDQPVTPAPALTGSGDATGSDQPVTPAPALTGSGDATGSDQPVTPAPALTGSDAARVN